MIKYKWSFKYNIDLFVNILGGLTWSDESAFEYTNWGVGEPNNAGGSEECGEMLMGSVNANNSGKWNDVPCSYTRGYVCKKPQGLFKF